MPRILITGNGFDLGFGLPTSYNDFIKIFKHLNKNNELDFSSIYKETEQFDLLIQNFNQFEIDKKAILELSERSIKNTWYNFFLQEHSIQTWVDFENRIFYVLKLISKGINLLKSKLTTSNSKLNEINKPHEFIVINNIEILEILKRFNIISFKNEYRDDDWYKSPFILQNNYYKIKYKHIIDIDSEKILNDIYKSLNEFIEIFRGYFIYFILPLYENYKGKIDGHIFNKVDEHYTFNYTPTFEKIIKIKSVTEYLHGKIDYTNEHKIVLGINKTPTKKNRDLYLKFTKTFQKLYLKTNYNFIRKHNFVYSESDTCEFQFIFWGHSLNVSDKKYIDEVFEFVKKLKPKRKEIIIIYHSEKSRFKLLLNLINIREENEIENLMRDKILKFYRIGSNELLNSIKRDLYVHNPIHFD